MILPDELTDSVSPDMAVIRPFKFAHFLLPGFSAMLKYVNSSCIQTTLIIALVCFISGLLVQVSFHLVPQPHEAAGLRGNNQVVINGQTVQITEQDLSYLAERHAQTPGVAALSGKDAISNSESQELYTAQLQVEKTAPNIVRAWRAAKVDWHSLVPSHNSLWERFGTPKSEGKLRALVAKETLITDYLTRYQETGLAGMYGHEHGPLTAYSGCNVFSSSCMVHDEDHCTTDELCAWATKEQLCVDVWDARAAATPIDEQKQCPKPKVVSDTGFTNARSPSQCRWWVHQPTVALDIDSESQSMFYHWWATWSGIVAHWKSALHARRDVHYFVSAINNPMFFHFFGLLSDNCWHRMAAKYSPQNVCYCNVEARAASQSREDANGAAAQMLQFLGLKDSKPPEKRVKIGLISRRRKRFILNEYELVERVKHMGYDCVLLPLESMTLYEQMRELQSLDVLVGIHGSALDNAVFLPRGMTPNCVFTGRRGCVVPHFTPALSI
jgi:hypothetical protein